MSSSFFGESFSFGGGLGSGLQLSTSPTVSPPADHRVKKSATTNDKKVPTDSKKKRSQSTTSRRSKKPRLDDGMTTYTDIQGRTSILPQGHVPVLLSDLLALRANQTSLSI